MKPEQLEAIRKRSSATSGNWLADYLKLQSAQIVLTDDVPALIDEVERLHAENKRLRSGIDSVMFDLYNEDCSDEFVVSQIVADLMQKLGGDA